jgi:hypothetical protein
MFVESIISHIGPVLRPPRRTFIRGTSLGRAALCLTDHAGQSVLSPPLGQRRSGRATQGRLRRRLSYTDGLLAHRTDHCSHCYRRGFVRVNRRR